ncbi:cyclophilin-like fold protein [Kribbella sp. NPDC049174]|uniref:cyclophilin-like fold protein n=1 Tax=Kribbella sp. NPDC049174 TaxID=3364112 RepID=UPI00371860B8
MALAACGSNATSDNANQAGQPTAPATSASVDPPAGSPSTTRPSSGPLPSPLSLDGQPVGADPDIGDVGYYAPGNDLVLYYGDQSYHNGIVVLGRMHGDAARRIATMEGSIKVLLQA